MHLKNLLLLIIAVSGCHSDDPQLTAWQAQQVAHVQAQAAEQQATTKALVTADAEARREMATLERSLQTERSEVGHQRDAIELERKSLAAERQRAPLLAVAIRGMGLLLLAALPLLVCLLLLRGPTADQEGTELEELLILNLAGEPSPLLPVRFGLAETPIEPLPFLAEGDRVNLEEDSAAADNDLI